MIITPEGHNIAVNLGLLIFCVATTALVIYWAVTIDNNIENNPEEK